MRNRNLSFVFFVVFLTAAVGSTGCSRESKGSTPLYGANGYILTPAGVQIAADRKSIPMPSEIAMTPDGKTVLTLSTGWVKTGGTHKITAIDALTDTVASSLPLAPYESFDGMAVNSAGTDIYVPGIQSQSGFILDVSIDTTRRMALKRAIPLQAYTTSTFGTQMTLLPTPAGIAVNGSTLVSANDVGYECGGSIAPPDCPQYPGETVSIIDLSKGAQAYTVVTGGLYPWAVAVTPDGSEAYVSNRGSSDVSVVSLSGTPVTTAVIPVQAGPAAIVSSPDGSKMYVANTLSDSVSVIDTSTKAVSSISLALYPTEPSVGGSPDGLAVSQDGSRLYVAMGADNAVAVVDTATDAVIGRIPVGSYPAGVVFDSLNGHIYTVNMYGIGHGPWVPAGYAQIFSFLSYNWYVYGSVSDIPVLSSSQLAGYTSRVLANDFVSPGRPPVPAAIRSAWSNIKHVVYIFRENKTADMEFGDLGARAGTRPIPCPYYAPGSDSALSGVPVTYGCASEAGKGFTTPNIHAMASQFALDTNFYLDIDTSIEGHPLAINGYESDYLRRIWAINLDYGGMNRTDDSGQPIAGLPGGSIFSRLLDAGVSFSVFGEGVPRLYTSAFNSPTPSEYLPYIDPSYGSQFSDVARADYFLGVFNTMVAADKFPQFVYLTFGDDHYPPGDYSENDYATAMVVDAIANSKYWGSTVIFLDEDDPQVGIDHVAQDRSFIVVVGPYAKHGHISFEHYGFPSVLRTIEMILGLQPMTEYDATALPMYDMFQATPDMTPFTAVPETWPTITTNPGGG
ncbi:MAG: SMP-30/gluconolactonase/LRE family protein [Deltaproteobacteria bacterium]|nr:SMP-30/gluconolactonase/LRE family protein [Deltaproteobacteria bacterium]MCL5276618.1 SMP-30/gluconolactonase/LRE family protein [Deltaproteobacteria bacterium]